MSNISQRLIFCELRHFICHITYNFKRRFIRSIETERNIANILNINVLFMRLLEKFNLNRHQLKN